MVEPLSQAIVRCILGEDVLRTVKYADPQNPNSNQLPAKRRLHQQCQNVNGTVLWYAKSVVDNPGNYGTLLRTNYWRYPALQPLMPFIDDEAPSKPKKVRQDRRVMATIIWHGRLQRERAGRMLLIVISFIVSMPVSQLSRWSFKELWECLTAISYVLIIKTAVQNTSMSLLLLTEWVTRVMEKRKKWSFRLHFFYWGYWADRAC